MKCKPNTKAGKLVKVHRYEQGGTVTEAEAEDRIDVQAAKDRVESGIDNYRKDLGVAFQSGKRGGGTVYTPEQKVDMQAAKGRIRDNSGVNEDIRTSVYKTARRK